MANIVRRAAFDVGSGATKMVVADFNVVTQKMIGAPLFAQEHPVGFKADAHSNRGALSEAIRAQGLRKIRWFADEARKLGATEVCGVATEVFRTAKHGEHFLADVKKETGVPIKIIPQEHEARLGFATASVLLGSDSKLPEEVAVWDSGGGSFQITCGCPQNFSSLNAFTGRLGTIPSYHELLATVQNKPNYQMGDSPNPVSLPQAQALIACLVDKLAPVPQWWRPGESAVAIGGQNSLFAVTHRALQASVVESKQQSHLPEEGTYNELSTVKVKPFGVAEGEAALRFVVEKSDKELLSIAGTNAQADPPSVVIPKIALFLAVAKHLSLSEVVYLPCTGGCAGLMSIGEWQPFNSSEPASL